MMNALRFLLFAFVIRPLLWGAIGLKVRHRERLVRRGPAVIVANHNSHLDTLVLMSLFPLARLHKVRPVAARDHFLDNGGLLRAATRILGVIYLDRQCRPSAGDPLAACDEALTRDHVLIVYPEGTRGRPEVPSTFRPGVAHLARRHPEMTFLPVFLEGCGKALPKGSRFPVPFLCKVRVGNPVRWVGDRSAFLSLLERRIFDRCSPAL